MLVRCYSVRPSRCLHTPRIKPTKFRNASTAGTVRTLMSIVSLWNRRQFENEHRFRPYAVQIWDSCFESAALCQAPAPPRLIWRPEKSPVERCCCQFGAKSIEKESPAIHQPRQIAWRRSHRNLYQKLSSSCCERCKSSRHDGDVNHQSAEKVQENTAWR